MVCEETWGAELIVEIALTEVDMNYAIDFPNPEHNYITYGTKEFVEAIHTESLYGFTVNERKDYGDNFTVVKLRYNGSLDLDKARRPLEWTRDNR